MKKVIPIGTGESGKSTLARRLSPRTICIYRALKRTPQYQNKIRPDVG